ncbi:MAG: type IV secretory system conjugative DNA transfer family protein [Myxococcaceae bacterium]
MTRASRRQRPLLARLAVAALLTLALTETVYRASVGTLPLSLPAPLASRLLVELRPYAQWRALPVQHPGTFFLGVLTAAGLAAVLARQGLILFAAAKARLSGTAVLAVDFTFPSRTVDVVREIARRPAGHSFVGLSPRRTKLGWRWKPVYLSPRQKATHRHVIGKTGSGKTTSILWPSVLQDALDGKGVLVLSAKGSDEEVGMMKAIAALCGRREQLRVFSLPAWNVPELFTHAYNILYVRPRTRTSAGGDPVATAQRVFSVLPMGDNVFYNTQAEVMFTNLCRLLHGMVDSAGNGIPFVLRDVSVCLKAVGNSGGWSRALRHCLDSSLEREAAAQVRAQVKQLDRDVLKSLSGVVGALDKFQSDIVNAYAPDIVFEDILQTNGLVYVQLPANLFRIQAPALGKVILMDVQHEGSLRQVFRRVRNQTPFSVTVDEFYNFADRSIVDSLNKLRDANLEYTLAHQSLADLELVSREFATAVWDNTRTKDVLSQDNPELCERIAKSIGTYHTKELTVRRREGPLATSLPTGDASARQVEAYRLHPNCIKSLARCGQGYLLADDGLWPLVYGMLPALSADYPLLRHNQQRAPGLRLYETFIA